MGAEPFMPVVATMKRPLELVLQEELGNVWRTGRVQTSEPILKCLEWRQGLGRLEEAAPGGSVMCGAQTGIHPGNAEPLKFRAQVQHEDRRKLSLHSSIDGAMLTSQRGLRKETYFEPH